MAGKAGQNGLQSLSEFELIEKLFAPIAARYPGSFKLQDDAGLMRPPPGCELVVTKDALVSGVHFFADDPADLVAKKLMRVNLSDLIAKGAKPLVALVAIGVSSALNEDWLSAFARGLGEDCTAFDVALLGGDTVLTGAVSTGGGPAWFSLTMIGSVPLSGFVPRAGGKAGDIIYVSGTIGDSSLGLLLHENRISDISHSVKDHLIRRYHLPEPPFGLGPAISRYVRASIDISDGLVGDLEKLCVASGVSARLDADQVPLSQAVRGVLAKHAELLPLVLTGGDDYQVLGAVEKSRALDFERAADEAGMTVTAIGFIEQSADMPDTPVVRVMHQGREMSFSTKSYTHF